MISYEMYVLYLELIRKTKLAISLLKKDTINGIFYLVESINRPTESKARHVLRTI